MKKIGSLIIVLCLVLLTGCSKGYTEGEYIGTAIDKSDGQENTASAIVNIDSNGKIIDVYLDTTYTTSEGIETTKKTLSEYYDDSSIGNWYEQVEILEQAVIDNQGIDFINLNEDGTTNSVSGCTIRIDALYEALNNALENSRK